MSICIFPGKFEPFHNGHMMVVQGMMKACGKAVIAVCRSGDDHLFTEDEVREMVGAALLSEDIVDATIVMVPDCEDDQEWADKVIEAAEWPEDATIWSGKEEVREIFENMGYKTQRIAPVPGIDGEQLRDWIVAGDSAWREKVPGGAMDVVQNKVDALREGE